MLSSTFDRRQSTSEMRLSRTRERFVFTINLWFAKEIRHSNFIQDLVQSVYNWQLMQCLYMWTRVISHVSWSLIFHLRCVFVTLFFDSGSFFERGNGSVERARLSSSADRPINSQVCYFFLNFKLKIWESIRCFALNQWTVWRRLIQSPHCRLFPSPRYLPLRAHCVELLLQLQATCDKYIPTLSLSVEVGDLWSLRVAKWIKIAANVGDDVDSPIEAPSDEDCRPCSRSGEYAQGNHPTG